MIQLNIKLKDPFLMQYAVTVGMTVMFRSSQQRESLSIVQNASINGNLGTDLFNL